MITVAGANRVLTVDLHAGQLQGFFNIPVDEMTALPTIADYFLAKNLPNPVVVAPDLGSSKRARNFAKISTPRWPSSKNAGLATSIIARFSI
jgi:ribose-phosphate pyrophosphokinase